MPWAYKATYCMQMNSVKLGTYLQPRLLEINKHTDHQSWINYRSIGSNNNTMVIAMQNPTKVNESAWAQKYNQYMSIGNNR